VSILTIAVSPRDNSHFVEVIRAVDRECHSSLLHNSTYIPSIHLHVEESLPVQGRVGLIILVIFSLNWFAL
jgi:hypothetical protein